MVARRSVFDFDASKIKKDGSYLAPRGREVEKADRAGVT
jgi:hypothetical protein